MREIGHFIGGKAVKGGSGRFGDVFDPNTGEIQAKVALARRFPTHAVTFNVALKWWSSPAGFRIC
jgi:malonate-semialdehyde dehydrogenase (acetylating) / methylmalonate-semialdehyde dehydrogenase